MFKQRLITTLILVPLALSILYFAPQSVFVAIIGLIVVGFYLEGIKLVPAVDCYWRSLVAAIVLFMLFIAYLSLAKFLVLDLVLWAAIWVLVWFYPTSQYIFDSRLVVAIALGILFASYAGSIVHLRSLYCGKHLIFYVLSLIWATDIGAYLIGKKWGKTLLIPAVSPGKTVEGMLGGIICASILSLIGGSIFHLMPILRWFVIGLGTILMAIIGDLLFSMLKRRCHLKDTGRLFPGHGGLLDRLDSAIAAFPFFVVLYERWM